MRLLVLGAKGMLGTDMVHLWKSHDVIPGDFSDADIRQIDQVRALVSKTRPDWIVLTAAYTDVDCSEKDPELAFAVNASGTQNVARVASQFEARLFFFSTDYVFDGTATRPYEPKDPIHPLNVYGASKAAGEQAVQCYAGAWCIARTSWLFGAHGNSFPEKILKASESRQVLEVVSDQIGSPTFTKDLATATLRLIEAEARGVVHITNSGVCSWFEFAQEVLQQAGRTSTRVHPVTSAQFPRPARRPAYSVLSSATLGTYGITLRDWRETVPLYLDDLRREGKLPGR